MFFFARRREFFAKTARRHIVRVFPCHGGWGGLLTFMFTCIPSWCYFAEIFSCTCTNLMLRSKDLFLHLLRCKILWCTLTHTWCYVSTRWLSWCYVSKMFSCTCELMMLGQRDLLLRLLCYKILSCTTTHTWCYVSKQQDLLLHSVRCKRRPGPKAALWVHTGGRLHAEENQR